METMESAFDEDIHEPLAKFNSERLFERLTADMKRLGKIQPEKDGLLSFTNFCLIYKLV